MLPVIGCNDKDDLTKTKTFVDEYDCSGAAATTSPRQQQPPTPLQYVYQLPPADTERQGKYGLWVYTCDEQDERIPIAEIRSDTHVYCVNHDLVKKHRLYGVLGWIGGWFLVEGGNDEAILGPYDSVSWTRGHVRLHPDQHAYCVDGVTARIVLRNSMPRLERMYVILVTTDNGSSRLNIDPSRQRPGRVDVPDPAVAGRRRTLPFTECPPDRKQK